MNSFINPEYIPGEPESAESITLSPPGEIIGVLYVTGTNGESLTMLDTHTHQIPFSDILENFNFRNSRPFGFKV